MVNSVNENGIEVGRAMTASPDIDVISFTGSSRTGQAIMAAAAPTLKRVGLELGGKAPAVIFADADLDRAVHELTHGALAMAGQICVAAARFLVHESIAKDFEARISAAFKAVRVGPGDRPDSQMGSLIDLENRARIERLIEQAGDEGEIILRGAPLSDAAFLTPTLFRIDDVASPLVQEELFGPIVSIETFADEQEAVAKANATAYGLAASVFTTDHHRALRMARAIRAGTVWINSHLRLFAEAETGGYGKSGAWAVARAEGLYELSRDQTHLFRTRTHRRDRMSNSYDVVINGGGPVGLGLAIELGQRGVRVCVVERSRTAAHPQGTEPDAAHLRAFPGLGL